jgi:hypothetical protein
VRHIGIEDRQIPRLYIYRLTVEGDGGAAFQNVNQFQIDMKGGDTGFSVTVQGIPMEYKGLFSPHPEEGLIYGCVVRWQYIVIHTQYHAPKYRLYYIK